MFILNRAQESEILDYIDEAHLPPLIVDILDKAQVSHND
jgi:hypothetical protein